MKKILKAIISPRSLILFLANKGFFNCLPDSIFLKILFYLKMGKPLKLNQPVTFNEKLQWLKLNDRNMKYTKLVDKYEVKKYVTEKIGEEYLIPTLGVWEHVEEVDFDKLPDQFVLKCTHDSGGIVICKDKSKFNKEQAKKKINKCLHRNYYWTFREWPYKSIKPRIICEPYMVDESGTELKDYKFFCFYGEVKALFIATDRGIDTRFDFFDVEFNHLQLVQHYKNGVKVPDKPLGFDRMVKLASHLSKDIPQVRIDFYDINGKIYFGEFTFYHFSGLEKFEPEEYDEIFGSWIKLP